MNQSQTADTAKKPRSVPFRNSAKGQQAVCGWISVLSPFIAAIAGYGAFLVNEANPTGQQNWLFIPLMLISVLSGCLVFAMPLGYFAVRSEAQRIDELINQFRVSKYLLRWDYSRATWQKFHHHKRKRAREGAVATLWGIGIAWALITGVVVAIWFIQGRPASGQNAFTTSRMLSIVGAISALALIGLAITCWVNARKQAVVAGTPATAIVGVAGVYIDGKWFTWASANRKLIRVDVITDGGMTILEFAVDLGRNVIVDSIPVPAGHEALAKKVAELILKSPVASTGGGAHIMTDLAQLMR